MMSRLSKAVETSGPVEPASMLRLPQMNPKVLSPRRFGIDGSEL